VLQAPDVINSMNYIFVQNTDNAYTYYDPYTLFKNLTFDQTGNLALYVHTYIKADQILGMLGGFSFFVVLIFRFWVRRHNKFKMYLDIGSQLLLKKSEEQILSEEGKSTCSYRPQQFTDWEVFMFSTFSFFYKKFRCAYSPRYLEAE